MEFYQTNYTKEAVIAKDITIVGQTQNNAEPSHLTKANGVIMPKTSNWKMQGVSFSNFPAGTNVLKTCSKCDDSLRFVNNVVEYIVEDITFDNISGNYLFFNGAFDNQVIYDLDGSLSTVHGGSSKTSGAVVYGFPHLTGESACPAAIDPTIWDSSLYCDQTVTVRGAMVTNIMPSNDFKGLAMRVKQISDASEIVDWEETIFTSIKSEFSNMEPHGMKPFAYSLPYICGRTYSLWFQTGLDFDHMAIDVTNKFEDTDDAIIFRINYLKTRELFEIFQMVNKVQSGQLISATSGAMLDPAACNFGDYTHDNEADVRHMTICATSRNKVRERVYLDINAIKCRYLCPAPTGEFEKEAFTRLWSNATQWPEGRVPVDGENVTIPGPWTIFIDIQPATIDFFEIDGGVFLLYNSSNPHITIQANGIWIRAGSFETVKDTTTGFYPGKLTFILTGSKTDHGWAFSPALAGNKIFVNTGVLKLYGPAPATTWTKLKAIARVGATTIQVVSVTGWAVGDELAISPSYSARA